MVVNGEGGEEVTGNDKGGRKYRRGEWVVGYNRGGRGDRK